MFEPTVRAGVLRVRAPGARWLSTGVDGGLSVADAAFNLTVPEGFSRTDVLAYAADRRRRAGFGETGPTLLTGVDLAHARGARSGSVVAYATAGLSNPAALPMEPSGTGPATASPGVPSGGDEPHFDGTVNLVIGTTRSLDDGALATLLSVAVEAKTATLLTGTGFPGTTTDAVVVGCDPAGEPAAFSGSGTAVGADARACVRAALRAALRARHPDGAVPETVAEAEYGVRTERVAEVFRLP